MNKLFFALLGMSMVFVSCKSSDGGVKENNGMVQVQNKPLGMWKSMEWKSSDNLKKEGIYYIAEVPADKKTISVSCTNYNRFWISSVNGNGVTDKNVFNGDYYTVKCEGNVLTVSFDANNSEERTFNITIQSGDVFSRLKFVQKGK